MRSVFPCVIQLVAVSFSGQRSPLCCLSFPLLYPSIASLLIVPTPLSSCRVESALTDYWVLRRMGFFDVLAREAVLTYPRSQDEQARFCVARATRK